MCHVQGDSLPEIGGSPLVLCARLLVRVLGQLEEPGLPRAAWRAERDADTCPERCRMPEHPILVCQRCRSVVQSPEDGVLVCACMLTHVRDQYWPQSWHVEDALLVPEPGSPEWGTNSPA